MVCEQGLRPLRRGHLPGHLARLTKGDSTGADSSDGAVAKTASESSLTPEVGGKVVVGTAGVRWHATEAVDVFSSFSFDNSNDKLVRFGMSVKF